MFPLVFLKNNTRKLLPFAQSNRSHMTNSPFLSFTGRFNRTNSLPLPIRYKSLPSASSPTPPPGSSTYNSPGSRWNSWRSGTAPGSRYAVRRGPYAGFEWAATGVLYPMGADGNEDSGGEGGSALMQSTIMIRHYYQHPIYKIKPVGVRVIGRQGDAHVCFRDIHDNATVIH